MANTSFDEHFEHDVEHLVSLVEKHIDIPENIAQYYPILYGTDFYTRFLSDRNDKNTLLAGC